MIEFSKSKLTGMEMPATAVARCFAVPQKRLRTKLERPNNMPGEIKLLCDKNNVL